MLAMIMIPCWCLAGIMFTFFTILVLHFLISAKHRVQLKLMGMSLLLQVFGDKPKYWINENSHLTITIEETLKDHQSSSMSRHVTKIVNLLVVLKVCRVSPNPSSSGDHECPKFHANPFSRCWDISVWIKVVDQAPLSSVELMLGWLKMEVVYKNEDLLNKNLTVFLGHCACIDGA